MCVYVCVRGFKKSTDLSISGDLVVSGCYGGLLIVTVQVSFCPAEQTAHHRQS